MWDFLKRVARSYYASEFCEAAIDSLHADLSVLSYLQQLSSTCFVNLTLFKGRVGLFSSSCDWFGRSTCQRELSWTARRHRAS
jgi:hypothetical protein